MAFSQMQAFVMTQMRSMGRIRCIVILILSASVVIKCVQCAFIVAISQSNGASVEALAFAVSSVYGRAASQTWINGTNDPEDYMYVMGSYEADCGLRVFASVFLFIWLSGGLVALTSIILNGLVIVVMINMVIYTLGLGIESLLVVALRPGHVISGCEWQTVDTILYTYIPLVVDSMTTIALITYCYWYTKVGMSFDPQEYQFRKEIRSRKHKSSMSSTFRLFDTVDSSP